VPTVFDNMSMMVKIDSQSIQLGLWYVKLIIIGYVSNEKERKKEDGM